VPESGDWWDASYLILWGSNVPVTRTPDAHWMTEARYRGQKVVVCSPDYSDAAKFADEWLSPAPGTDGALAMAMGHVILREFLVDRQVPYFADYLTRLTDAPFLVTLESSGASGGAVRPGKFLTADALGEDSENADFKPVVLDGRTGQPVVPGGSLGFRFGEGGVGRWNLNLGDIAPVLTMQDPEAERVAVDLPRFDADDGTAGMIRRGVPTRRIAGRLVTTVFDLLLAQYGVGRDGLPGDWPSSYADADHPCTPAWQVVSASKFSLARQAA
jgi:nitrate reductase / nitrite oxidoreductase, alpha subunit